jgi:hypothetical protein
MAPDVICLRCAGRRKAFTQQADRTKDHDIHRSSSLPKKKQSRCTISTTRVRVQTASIVNSQWIRLVMVGQLGWPTGADQQQ